MNCEDHRRLLALLSDRTRIWFNQLIQSMAVEHDISGPQIDNVPEHRYKDMAFQSTCAMADDIWGGKVAGDSADDYLKNSSLRFRAIMLRAMGVGEIQVASHEVNGISGEAAREIVRLRKLWSAVLRGELNARVLKKQPLYRKYASYFNEWLEPSAIAALAIEIAEDLEPNQEQSGEIEFP